MIQSPIRQLYELYRSRQLEKKAREDRRAVAGDRRIWPRPFHSGKGTAEHAHSVPAVMLPGSFVSCPGCGRRALRRKWEEGAYVCPNCGRYAALGGYDRLQRILDPGSFRELDADLAAEDPLDFPGYREKLTKQVEKTGLSESVISAVGSIAHIRVVTVVLDSRFFMGSMSRTVGEKVTRAVEYADRERLPLIIFSASGGARMQEGIYSLMQMAKTTAAIERFSEHGGLYISFLTHPTTGGVTASFATLGDITLAEPGALIGFAGPRVIEQTIRRKLPQGFQRAEYLEQHGFVDRIVARSEMRTVLADILKLHADAGHRRTAIGAGGAIG